MMLFDIRMMVSETNNHINGSGQKCEMTDMLTHSVEGDEFLRNLC